MATEGVAMGRAVAVRADYTAGEVRRLAKRATDAAQARRLLAIAAVLDGACRTAAAKIGGMDRQTLRDWVIRFNDQGPEGLINIPSPGVPPKLDATHRAFLARIVEEGPIPAAHGVVRWRACDLIMRLHEEFGLSTFDAPDRVVGQLAQMVQLRPPNDVRAAVSAFFMIVGCCRRKPANAGLLCGGVRADGVTWG
jgi:transposase